MIFILVKTKITVKIVSKNTTQGLRMHLFYLTATAEIKSINFII